MQPASEKCCHLEEFGCKEDSLKEDQFCFNQNQDNVLAQNQPLRASRSPTHQALYSAAATLLSFHHPQVKKNCSPEKNKLV